MEGLMEELKPVVTMDMILSTFSKKSEEKRLREIKASVVSMLTTDPGGLFDEDQPEIEKQVEELIKLDKKAGEKSRLTFSNGKYRQRRNVTLPGGANAELQANDYTGAAGECAVMSELLFRGYNVNRMVVDGGIDLVAFKDSTYYYIQVKTVGIKDGVIRAFIPIANFERNKIYQSQMRYFIVGRYTDKNGDEHNHFFMFTHSEIEMAIYNQYVKRGQSDISIKIKFHPLTNKPILYNDNTEQDAGWFYNRF